MTETDPADRRRRRRSSGYYRSSSSPVLAFTSLACSVAGLTLWSFVLVLGPRLGFTAGALAAEESGTTVLFVLAGLVAVLLLVFGVGLGAGALLTSRRKRWSAILGTVLGGVGLVILALAVLVAISSE